MLQPDERALLIDGLRPPAGMRLDYAVGTTFSLDLDALLVAPVTFALFDARLSEGTEDADPLSLLEAVRRHAGNIDLFCQTGQVALPEKYRPITAYLEGSVHQCSVGRPHRIFHPKVWLLRFTSADSTSYRLLALSRNLTFSRSWDTLVRLDGSPGVPDPRNEPLGAFLDALPNLALDQTTDLSRVPQLASEVRSVKWVVPEGFSRAEFLAFGIGNDPKLPDYERLLVMAPFASSKRLRALAASAGNILVSRTETLDRLDDQALGSYDDVYTLSPAAADPETEDALVASEELAERPGHNLVGLHAKLYVAENGDQVTLITGSPNATDAAFAGNVEFAIALTGAKQVVGIDRILRSARDEASLVDLLEPYGRNGAADESDDVEEAARHLEELGRRIAEIGFTLSVEERDDAIYGLVLRSDRPIPNLGDASLKAWPISRRAAAADLIGGAPAAASFSGLSLEAITSFLCLELTGTLDGRPATTRVVLNARLTGAPEDRHQRILTAALRSKGDVLRYLLFLLADVGDPDAIAEVTRLISHQNHTTDLRAPEIPLFESMVRALHRRPESLDHINRLIADLQQTPKGRDLLPNGLDEVWPAIWEARQEVQP